MIAPTAEEVFVSYQSPVGPRVTHCRGTLIVSSLEVLRRQGHFERYLPLLPRECRDELLATMPTSWLSISLARQHYQACHDLQLSAPALDAIADEVGNRIATTFLATFLRSTRTVGGTPWHSLKQAHLLVPRVLQGGSVRIVKVGPKDARVETRGLSLLQVPYFARAFCTILKGAALMFTKSAYSRQLESKESDLHLALLSWV